MNKEQSHLFQIGNPSGNSTGRPPGALNIKNRIRKYLNDHPDEIERIVKHFVQKNPELMWQMLEGKPQAVVNMGVDKDSIEELTTFFKAMGGKKE